MSNWSHIVTYIHAHSVPLQAKFSKHQMLLVHWKEKKRKNRNGSNYFAEKSNRADQKAHQGANNDMFAKKKSNNYKSWLYFQLFKALWPEWIMYTYNLRSTGSIFLFHNALKWNLNLNFIQFHAVLSHIERKRPFWTKQNYVDLPAGCLVSVCKYILLTLNPHR